MSRTLKEVIDQVDGIKPNAFSNEEKTRWINSVEGRVQTDIWLRASCEITQYTWAEDQNTELLIEPPHDDVYGLWLQAQIDYANGEYTKYQNTMAFYNEAWGNYVRFFAGRYEPAQGYNTNTPRPVPDDWL